MDTRRSNITNTSHICVYPPGSKGSTSVVLFWICVHAQANRICWANCRGEASRAILEVWGRAAGRVALTLAWEEEGCRFAGGCRRGV